MDSKTARVRGVYAIADAAVRPDIPLPVKAQLFVKGGASVVQLRGKSLKIREFVELSRQAVAICRRAGVPCLINDRVDVALMVEADGVHLGEDDLPASDARRILGPSRIIGATVRRAAQARQVQSEGADYVGLGPVYPTRTKRLEVPVLGIKKFRELVRRIELPVVGIGGINQQNISAVAAAGAAAAAVISGLVESDLVENTKAMVRAWERG